MDTTGSINSLVSMPTGTVLSLQNKNGTKELHAPYAVNNLPVQAGNSPASYLYRKATRHVLSSYEQRLLYIHNRMTISPTFALQAHTLLQTGKVEEAIALCERGLEVYPDYATAYSILAQAYERIENSSHAAAVLERGMRRLPLERSLLRIKTGKENNRSVLPSQPIANQPPDVVQPDILAGLVFTAPEYDIPTRPVNSTTDEKSVPEEAVHTTIEWDSAPEVTELVEEQELELQNAEQEPEIEEFISNEPAIEQGNYPVLAQEVDPTAPGKQEEPEPGQYEPQQPEIEQPEQKPEIELPEPDKPEIELPEPDKPEIREPEQEPGIELPEPDKPEIEQPERKPEIELPEPEQKPDIQEPAKEPEIELPEPDKPEIELPEPDKPEIQEPEQEPGIELPEPQQPEIELPGSAQKNEQNISTGDSVKPITTNGSPASLSLRSTDNEPSGNGVASPRHSHLRIIESADTAEMPSLIWRSRNVRLIPGLEFTPLRFESKKDKLYRPAYRIPDPPPFPEFEVTKKKPVRFQQRLDDSRAALTPLEELARRLEAARIPRVEEEETHPVAPAPPSRNEQSSPMITETMAKIYEMQGAIGEAVKAYEALAHQKPDMAEKYIKKARELKNKM